MKYILSGGGTGGHIYPALAIANEIKEQDPEAEILYVGKADSLEEELVTKEGYSFAPIHISGLPRRKLNKDTVITAFNLMRGLMECGKIIKEFKPDIVIGTGGYVCAPIVLKAQQKKIKTIIQEQNAYPGKTNRILSKKANLIALNFQEAKQYFNNENIIFTGNPIRKDFQNINIDEARKQLGLKKEERLVFSFGGSGGQESTNQAILEMIQTYKNFPFHLVHVTGKSHYEEFMEKAGSLPDHVQVYDYSYEVPKYLMAADLIIASSSAMTLAEISAVGKASILIPKSYTAGNHQVHNANSYQDIEASKVILEEDLTGEVLYREINHLMEDEPLRHRMAENSKKLGNDNAVKVLVNEIMK